VPFPLFFKLTLYLLVLDAFGALYLTGILDWIGLVGLLLPIVYQREHVHLEPRREGAQDVVRAQPVPAIGRIGQAVSEEEDPHTRCASTSSS
jgi:hypothetical protein